MQSNSNVYMSAAGPPSSTSPSAAMQNQSAYTIPGSFQYSAPPAGINNGPLLSGVPYNSSTTSSSVPHSSSVSPLHNAVIVSEGEFETVRKQTDRTWLIVFFVFLFFCLIFICIAIREGNPARLYKGMNYQGLVCGYDAPVVDLPYLYVPLDPRENYPTLMLKDARCVEQCFTEEDVEGGKAVYVAIRDSTKDADKTSAITMEFKLLSPVYATFLMSDAYCVPKGDTLRSQFQPIVGSFSSQIKHAIGSFKSAWMTVLSCIVLSIVLSVCYVFLLRIHSAFVFALMAMFSVVISFISGFYLLYHGAAAFLYEYKGQLFYLDYVSAIITGLIMLVICAVLAGSLVVSRRGILTAVKILDCAGGTIFDMPNILIAPTIFSFLLLIFFFLWLVGYMYIASCGVVDDTYYSMDLQRNGDAAIVPLHRSVVWDGKAAIFTLFWWVLLLWIFEFLMAFCHFVLAYAGTVWYFSPPEGGEDRDVGWCPPLVALSLGLIFHSGSFALGGIAMGITRPIRLLFGWTATNKAFLTQNSAVIFNLKHCFKGVINQISYIVDRFTSSGYIEMSVSSRPFFPAMEKSLNRILNSRSPAAQLHGVCSYASVIGTVAISITSGLICYATLSGFEVYNSVESEYFVASPLFVSYMTTIVTSVIAALYLSVWDTIADTLMYCFLVESVQPPVVDENPLTKVHAPPSLRELLLEVYEESQMQPYAFQ